jgi:signal transduction histidine kinase
MSRTLEAASGDIPSARKDLSSGEIVPGPSPIDRTLRTECDRIAAVRHDEVLQDFAICALKTQLCGRLVEKGQYDTVAAELSLLEDYLNRTIDKVRDVVSTLKQPRKELSQL